MNIVRVWDGTAPPPHTQTQISFKLFINCPIYLFPTVLSKIQGESFIDKSEMNAAELRQNMGIKAINFRQ